MTVSGVPSASPVHSAVPTGSGSSNLVIYNPFIQDQTSAASDSFNPSDDSGRMLKIKCERTILCRGEVMWILAAECCMLIDDVCRVCGAQKASLARSSARSSSSSCLNGTHNLSVPIASFRLSTI